MEQASPGRFPRHIADEAHLRFIAAFKERYAANGMKGLSAATLSAKTGYSRSAFYRYFESVYDLFDLAEVEATPYENMAYLVENADAVDMADITYRSSRFSNRNKTSSACSPSTATTTAITTARRRQRMPSAPAWNTNVSRLALSQASTPGSPIVPCRRRSLLPQRLLQQRLDVGKRRDGHAPALAGGKAGLGNDHRDGLVGDDARR